MALRMLCSTTMRRAAGGLRSLASPSAQQIFSDLTFGGDVQQSQGVLSQSWSHRDSLKSCFGFGSARGKKSVVKKLSEVLESEIEHEKENYEQDEMVKRGPPYDFKLKEEGAVMTLTRTLEGEDIRVELAFTTQPDGHPENPDDPDSPVQQNVVFNVVVTKGVDVLFCEVESDGGYLEIQHVGLGQTGKEPADTDYTGPSFPEMDEAVQDTMGEWLVARGVGPELADYLLQLVHDRESQAYQKWLGEFKAFIDK